MANLPYKPVPKNPLDNKGGFPKEELKYRNPYTDKFVKGLGYNSEEFLRFQDPTVLSFKLMFSFNDKFGLLDSSGSVNSALGFLRRIGDKTREQYLIAFIELFKKINEKTPWYFQTIEGLDNFWKRDYMKMTSEENKISIGCLESIDLRMTAVLDLYRKACFDWKHRREVVPINLRRFDLLIYVNDPRIFNDFKGLSDAESSKKREEQFKIFGEKIFDFDFDDELNIGRTTNKNLFKLYECEFDINESNQHLTKVTNSDLNDQQVVQKITISYRDKEEDNVYNMYFQGTVSDNVADAGRFSNKQTPKIIFASPLTGDNTVGLEEADNNIENLKKPKPFITQLGESLELESQSFSNAIKSIPESAKSIFTEQQLINVIRGQLSNLTESLLGKILNIDIFAGTSNSLSNKNENISIDLTPALNPSLTLENLETNLQNNVVGISEFLTGLNDNLPANLSEYLENQISNNVQNLTANLEVDINVIEDLTNLDLVGSAVVDDSVENIEEGSSTGNNSIGLSEILDFTISSLNDSTNISLFPNQNVNDSIELDLESVVYEIDETIIDLGETSNLIVDLDESLEIDLGNDVVFLNSNLETNVVFLEDSLNIKLLEAKLLQDDLNLNLTTTIPLKENLENLKSTINPLKESLENLKSDTNIIKENLNINLVKANVLSDDLNLTLQIVNSKQDLLESNLGIVKINNDDLFLNLAKPNIIEEKLDFELTFARFIKDEKDFNLNKTNIIEENLDFELKGVSNAIENLKDIDLVKAEFKPDNLSNNLKQANIIEDNLNISLKNAESLKDILDLDLTNPLVVVEQLQNDQIPAIVINEILDPIALDAWIPNYINPLKGC